MVGTRMRLLAGFLLLGAAATALGLTLGGAGGDAVAKPVASATLPAAPAASDTAVVSPRTTYDAAGSFRVDGKRFFPIGLTMPPPLGGRTPWGTAAIDELVDGGITVFRTGPSGRDWTDEHLTQAQAWAEAAAVRGALTWVHLRELAAARPGTPREARLVQVVETLRDSPGMGLWKGADEPWPRYLPRDLAHAFATVKALDPNHVFHTIFGPFSVNGTMLQPPPRPPDLRPYNAVTDTRGTDVYPIYHPDNPVKIRRLHMVGRWMAALRRATGRNAVTMTLQICFKGAKSRYRDDYVLPTKRQERYMVYDAIINGARGLFFFGGELPRCQTERDRALGWNWTFWNRVLEDLVDEIAEGSPLHAALLRPETTVRLRTNSTRTGAIRRYGRSGELWVIAAHNGGQTRAVTIRGLPPWARSGRLYPGGGRVTAAGGKLTLHFPRWGVRVVRFVRP
ncbi:MAG TPA: hypothetical protein VD769_01155 [Gaiellaceae bacterium]|nr:hypothetical protein [Gaiellaceae bacterium]